MPEARLRALRDVSLRLRGERNERVEGSLRRWRTASALQYLDCRRDSPRIRALRGACSHFPQLFLLNRAPRGSWSRRPRLVELVDRAQERHERALHARLDDRLSPLVDAPPIDVGDLFDLRESQARQRADRPLRRFGDGRDVVRVVKQPRRECSEECDQRPHVLLRKVLRGGGPLRASALEELQRRRRSIARLRKLAEAEPRGPRLERSLLVPRASVLFLPSSPVLPT